MSKVRLYGATSGYVDLAAPDVSPDATLTLPATFAGIGSNVVQTVKTDTFSTSSTSFTDVTGLSATITPTSATSKILVNVSVPWSYQGGNVDRTMKFQIVRGSTDLIIPDSPGSRNVGFFGGNTEGDQYSMHVATFMLLDSPGTTSATTYKITTRVGSAGTGRVNISSTTSDSAAVNVGVSTLTLIEVAA